MVVLTGPATTSAGEVLALAFKGLDNVRLMGEPTAGFTTANTTYDLFDGSTLVLTVCREADRTGKIYEGKIIPDDLIKTDPLNRNDDVVKANAIMWLQSQ
jgi:C-terminal processing protease CtpA/Prc